MCDGNMETPLTSELMIADIVVSRVVLIRVRRKRCRIFPSVVILEMKVLFDVEFADGEAAGMDERKR